MVALLKDLPGEEKEQSLEMCLNSPLATAAGPVSPPPARCLTHVIGYSQRELEGRHPPPYLGYPGYDQVSSVAYYYPSVPDSSRSSAYLRCCLFLMSVFILLAFVVTMVLWLILRPKLPAFRVDTLAVSNFNASRSNFSAIWYADVTFENTDHKLDLYFHRIYSYIFYRDYLLASSLNDKSFLLGTRKKEALRVILSTNDSDDEMPLAEEMNDERKGGLVNFNLRMLVWLSFRQGWWWTRSHHLKVLCDDLKMSFVSANGSGEFSAGHSRSCSVIF